MKLTKSKTKEFIKRIKDGNNSDLKELEQNLIDHPELVNLTIQGMEKGIDGFSSLQLAIRYFNFAFAEKLVKYGANVNYIDESPVRYYHYPLFFDLIEMMKIIIGWNDVSLEKKKDVLNEAISLWDLMESYGLDYLLTSPKTEMTKPENCLSAAIRLIGANSGYGINHRVHVEKYYNPPEPSRTEYRLSGESRNIEKEQLYKEILERIINHVDSKLIDSVDCSEHRALSLSITPFFEEKGYVDTFSLEVANDLVKRKFGRDLPNYRGEEALKSIDNRIKRFANNV